MWPGTREYNEIRHPKPGLAGNGGTICGDSLSGGPASRNGGEWDEVDPTLCSETQEFKLMGVGLIREVRGGSKEVFPRGVEEEFDISRDAPWARQKVGFKADSPQIRTLDL